MDNPQWLTKMTTYCEQSLAIRLRTEQAVSAVREVYTCLLVLTHELREVRNDGMPDPDYNEQLFNFECELFCKLEVNGKVILVETFAGKRIYYAYVENEAESKARASEVLTKFGLTLETSFRGGADPHWKFYSQYVSDMKLNHGLQNELV